MNLLCPNCQKPLTVPEQYAGQPMRCPLCAGTFTVPALPSSAPPPPPPAPSAPADVYGLKDPPHAPAPAAPPPPVPDMSLGTAPSAPKLPPTFTSSPPPAGPPPTYTEDKPSYPSTPAPEGYQRKYTIWFSPQVLQYVAPVALFLVLVLTCFAWTGVYPGGVPSAWQNAWQATYGGWSYDQDVTNRHPPFAKGFEPGWNFLLIFYLLMFLPTLLVTVGCLALAFMPAAKLPPAVHPILPWRWGIVAALNLILLLFLALQLVLGFSLENNYIAARDKEVADRAAARTAQETPDLRDDAIARGEAHKQVSWTIWLDLALFFHVLAIAGAGLMFWISRRGGRPAARMDLLW